MLKLIDFAERLLVILLAIPFLAAFFAVLPVHPYFIMVALVELLSVVLIIIRKPGEIAATPYAFTIAIIGTALPLLVRPAATPGAALAPVAATMPLMLLGLTLSVCAKLFLNRSFGMVAANRGVKIGGPYRVIRHPMYLGYMITQAAFLLASFTLRNMLLYLVAWTFQLLRIIEEEKMLCRDANYRALASRVRFRLVPGLF